MKRSLIIIAFLFSSIGFAQNSKKYLTDMEYDALEAFLAQEAPYSYVDKHFFNENTIKRFKGNYRKNKDFYKNADSICRTSSDTLDLKLYCPLADSFKSQASILSNEELNFLVEKYEKKQAQFLLNLEDILSKTTLQKHTDDYYDKIQYDNYGPQKNLHEFPSIRIKNLYLNSSQTIAVIAYSVINNEYSGSNTLFHLLVRKDGVWWKSLGDLKL